MVEENTGPSTPNPFGNAFDGAETVLGTERFRDTDATTHRHWVVESMTRRNALGKPTGYELHPIDVIKPTRETVGFTLRPTGFFDQNPALDAP